MGDMADEFIDRALLLEAEMECEAQAYQAEMLQTNTWTTLEGRVIPVSNMGTAHLDNSIAMLERNFLNHPLLPMLKEERAKR